MAVSIKDLRYKTKEVLSHIKRGDESIITFHGKPIARIVAISTRKSHELSDIGFGMWKDNSQNKKVEEWLNDLRKPRYPR